MVARPMWIAAVLVAPVRKRLIAYKLRKGRGGDDLVLAGTTADRFVPSTVRRCALKAWKTAGLQPITRRGKMEDKLRLIHVGAACFGGAK